MRLNYKLWLEHEDKVLFGQGRQELLAAIAETGSLAGAAQKLAMSYRAAWGRLKASEQRLGFPLVEHGPQGRRTTQLTPEGRELLAWYNQLDKEMISFLEEAEGRRPAFLDSVPQRKTEP
ncbi:MAG: LysR family transcriptional regulator [Pseudomonadota bacterium]